MALVTRLHNHRHTQGVHKEEVPRGTAQVTVESVIGQGALETPAKETLEVEAAVRTRQNSRRCHSHHSQDILQSQELYL